MSDTIDKLIRLARGDVDVVQAAIRQAAQGGASADLGEVVRAVLRLRPSPSPLAAEGKSEGEP